MNKAKRGRPKNIKQLQHNTLKYKGKPQLINKDGSLRANGYFQKGSKTKMILDHLKSGKTLSQLDCYPPSKFNTIRLGGIIGELRKRGYEIHTKNVVNKKTNSTHGVYYMDVEK
tara:strand:- start:5058 stop:5399 length:342 start_codon:yes stop_codon:yes gene_type:complete